MQAARPRMFLAPLQLGLAVQLHCHFASRFLIDTLNSLGYCASYNQVQQFNQSAAVYEGTDIPEKEELREKLAPLSPSQMI